MEQINYKFVDRTGASESTSEILDPVLIKKEAIQTEVERLAGLPAAANGRRVSQIVNTAAVVGDCLAAGTAVSLCVLKPGEHTQRIRHNSSLVGSVDPELQDQILRTQRGCLEKHRCK